MVVPADVSCTLTPDAAEPGQLAGSRKLTQQHRVRVSVLLNNLVGAGEQEAQLVRAPLAPQHQRNVERMRAGLNFCRDAYI